MRLPLLPLLAGLSLLLACPPAPTADDDDDQGDDDDSAGPPEASFAPGLTEVFVTQEIDGTPVERRILVHAPSTVDPARDYPIVFAFHGNGGTADAWPGQLGTLVDTGAFVGLYLDGHLNSWNLGEEASTADDVAFVDMAFQALRAYSGVDGERMFAMGSSNGAGMVQKLAIETERFRAVAAFATALFEDQAPTGETPPISVLQVHGVEDEVCPYEGGASPTGHTFQAAEDSAAVWAAHNGCAATPAEELVEGGHTRFSWSDCDEDTQVVHYRLEGIGHGLPPDLLGGTGQIAWDFFSGF